MDFLAKHRREIFILFILTLGYFVLRLPNLTLQPIFADEAIYIRWAQVMKSEPTLRFLPLSDGKTPLFMWAMIPLFKFVSDPLLAGRLLSVIAGFFTLLGVFFLSKRVFSLRTAFWASLLYVIVPYTVFFDRMALVDSMLSAFTVWVVYFALWQIRSLRLDVSMILGVLMGSAILTKTPGMFNLLLLPLTALGFKREKEKRNTLVKVVVLWGVAVLIALTIYNALRLGPNFHLLSSRNADYIFSPLELIGRPLDPFLPHFNDILDWFPKLLTWPVLFATVIGIIYILYGLLKRSFRGQYLERCIVLFWAIIPLLVNMAFLRTFTARYLLAEIPLLLIVAGFGVTKLLPPFSYIKRLPILIMLIVLLPLPLFFNYLLLKFPQDAPLPKAERKGYFEDWTAGYGFSEIARFLLEKNKEGKVVVGTEGFFGTLPDGLYIYLDKSGISVVGSTATISAQIRKAAKDNLTFFVGNKKNLEGSANNTELIFEFIKAENPQTKESDATVLYRVLPERN